ncbi:MAG: F0F1 ATP synthase subunit A [Candidatus Peribacteria bacterium]|jgi:F-type H+-transporting ATPase subunit a|nr:F0F1 ATP synthase subunit A [Candidatus Peribacteria bacterium]
MTFHIVSIRAKRGKSQKSFSLTIDYLMETVYNFFEDILGEKAPFWIKSYITNLFLIILIANLLGLALDILLSPFPFLEQYIQSPTGDISFTLALAIGSVGVLLVIEAKTKGIRKFLYSYLPVLGTNLFALSKPSTHLWRYYLVRPFAKSFDIIISLFIGVLNSIGMVAKVISLAFRLYGNMMAGSILLAVISMMMGQMTKSWLAGWEFPFLIPLIFYLQSALTAVVQAFVFSLLMSVFIKMSLEEEQEPKKLKEDFVSQALVEHMQ